MYYYLNGELTVCEGGLAVVDCGGVGYKLTTSLLTSQNLADKIGQKVKMFTHLAVREDGVELFGFESNEERACFNHNVIYLFDFGGRFCVHTRYNLLNVS